MRLLMQNKKLSWPLLATVIILTALVGIHLTRHPKASDIQIVSHPDGTLIQANGDPAVYLIDSAKRRHVLDPNVLSSQGYSWNQVKAATAVDNSLAIGS